MWSSEWSGHWSLYTFLCYALCAWNQPFRFTLCNHPPTTVTVTLVFRNLAGYPKHLKKYIEISAHLHKQTCAWLACSHTHSPPAHTHTNTCARTHTHTNTCARMHTHTHTKPVPLISPVTDTSLRRTKSHLFPTRMIGVWWAGRRWRRAIRSSEACRKEDRSVIEYTSRYASPVCIHWSWDEPPSSWREHK